MNDIEQTQHYTTNADKILCNLMEYMPLNKIIIEPFVGKGDLIPYIKEKTDKIEIYDLDSNLCVSRDTLKYPPDYTEKYVITNPPYMARNKSKDKNIYDMYNLDDLYKIALYTMIKGNVEGGILIIPINFLTDENTEKLRNLFFEKYRIHHINYFTYKIFDNTSYSICSFYFDKVNVDYTILDVYTTDGVKRIKTKLKGRLFQEFYDSLEVKPVVSRVIESNIKQATNIKIYCIDNHKEKIRAEYCEDVYVGKNTDRAFFTMTQPNDIILTTDDQKNIIKKFNNYLDRCRNQYYNLIMTNYREDNRKRIGFDLAYKILTLIIEGNIDD
jgi:hypothetical protein